MDAVEQLSEIDIGLLHRHTGREMLAAVCIAKRCFPAVKFVVSVQRATTINVNRPGVYEIEGVDGFIIGQDGLADRLYELTGRRPSGVAMNIALRNRKPLLGMGVKCIGVYCKRTKQILPFEEAA